jgi:hypothetical protein
MPGRVAHARFAAAAVIGVSIAAVVLPATAGTGAKRGGAGCADTRPVVAHHAGGRVLAHQPRSLPRACGTSTGYPGAESHLVIRNDGSVVYTPAVLPSGSLGIGSLPGDQYGDSQSNASPGALAVTSDKGAHWRLVKPAGVTWNPTDHSDYVDPVSGRMFFEDYGPIPVQPSFGADQEGPAHINYSDDLEHWHHTVIRGLTLPENPRFTSGRAPAGQPKPKGGYPSVTYFCANTNVGFVSPVIGGRICYRSLDGGSSWEQRSLLFSGATPQHPECNGQGEVYSAIDGYYPQPAPDGTLYVMVACGGTTYLARSKDEAATFPILQGQSDPITLPVQTPGPGDVGGSPELRITGDGTFLLSYQRGNKLLMRISATRGITWSKPIDVTAPGVTAVMQWTMAANARGDVAFAYLGQRKGQSTWDGYVTGSHDVLRGLRSPGGPVFLSGQVNPKDRPLLYGDSVQGSGYLEGTPLPFPPPFNNQMFGNDFIGAALAPDGTPWGSFTQDCGPSRESAGCVKQHGQTRGFAGHLG